MKRWGQRAARVIPTGIWWASLLIIVALPFHVVLYSLLLAHATPLAGPFRDWKEALVVVMTIAAAGLALAEPRLRRQLIRQPEAWLIAAFVLLNLGFGLITPDRSAAVLAIKINVVFLLLFLATWVAAWLRPQLVNTRTLLWCYLVPAAVVGLFGLAQLWWLPAHFLTHLGYGTGPNQIAPIEFVQNSTILRVQSFLFGPNQFGSYLALPIILVAWLLTRCRRWTTLAPLAGLELILLVNLYGSQSRGSWLGVAVGLVALGWLQLRGVWRAGLTVAFVAAAVAFVLLLPSLSHGRFSAQILHDTTAGATGASSSNLLHLDRLRTGWTELVHHPLGQNLAVVGRASDLVGDSFYTENFYLQLADQMGWEGAALFVAIVILVGIRLYQAINYQPLALPFLAALIGISVMNFLAHTWSDGATALLWWGGAGLIAGAAAQKQAA